MFGTPNRIWRKACYRLYSDLLMPSRLELFDRLLQTAVDGGYETHSILSFWQLLEAGRRLSGKKYLILRHDVDTDAATACRMWELERKRNVISSFYFRLSTLSPSLMSEMHASGVEASYHYEEVATISKQRGLTTVRDVYDQLPEIREMFKLNLFRLRERTGLLMLSAASHGDFVNRKLGITNTVILADKTFRDEVNIKVEAYDQALMSYVTSRHSDRAYPVFWAPDDPLSALRRGEEVVHILTHPRQWHAAPSVNLSDNLGRAWEGARYYFKSARRNRNLDGVTLN
jgi:hypothetical protein